jgi:hypothetical protein
LEVEVEGGCAARVEVEGEVEGEVEVGVEGGCAARVEDEVGGAGWRLKAPN